MHRRFVDRYVQVSSILAVSCNVCRLAAPPSPILSPYKSITNTLKNMPLEEYDDADWCLFDDYDVISDVPIPQLAPFIYSAHGRGTKVIQTTRDVTSWAER